MYMPSTLVEFIKKDEIVEELEEFEGEFEREKFVNMKFFILKKYFPSFIYLFISSFIIIIRKKHKTNPKKVTHKVFFLKINL